MTLVLDTNIVLDLLVFRDAALSRVQRAVDECRATIITHAPAIDELRRVLGYPQWKLTSAEQQDLLHRYLTMAREVAVPKDCTLGTLLLPGGFPRCRDADDQHFLELAYHAKADALLSKDKQVLRLRNRAARFGVTILSPMELWATL